MSIWGYGALTALVAGLTYWPWFRFVEAHGGYSRLMAHHRGYVGGLGSWLPHLRVQVDQMSALAGGPIWVAAGAAGAFLAAQLVIGGGGLTRRGGLAVMGALALIAARLPSLYWWIISFWLPKELSGQGASRRLLAVAWLGLTLATPFYHPYARLWMPLLCLGWIITAGYLAAELSGFARDTDAADRSRELRLDRTLVLRLAWFLLLYGVVLSRGENPRSFPGPGGNPGPLAPSDSLRAAVREALVDLPKDTPGLRLLARPPVTFYLGGRFAVQTEPSLHRLMRPGPPGFWALVDSAQLRQDLLGEEVGVEWLGDRWEIEERYATELNLPTLLDVAPGAARGGRASAVDAPLLLLRPRASGTSR